MVPESGINALGAGPICSYSGNVIKSKIIIIFNFGLISVFTKGFEKYSWKIIMIISKHTFSCKTVATASFPYLPLPNGTCCGRYNVFSSVRLSVNFVCFL